MDELLDVVDQTDIVIGKKPRSFFYEHGLSNFRVINCFLKNSRGQLWIPRRTAQKKLFPLHLDVSVGGHVQSGENYESAFIRELKEELNIDEFQISYQIVGYLTPHKNRVSAFMTVYEIVTDETPSFNQDDFIEAMWITPKSLRELIISGEPTKSDLPKLLKFIYNI